MQTRFTDENAEGPLRFRARLLEVGGLAAAAAIVIGLTVVVYGQVGHFQFINYDDNDYVYENEHVRQGLSLDGVTWAFTTGALGNWHPLTWLSFMLDVEFFGVNSGAMHVVNLVFHGANSLLVLFLFWTMTRSLATSAFVSALFAIHPLHVESVAWISERKDVLAAFFGLLALLAYVQFAARPTAWRNAIVAVMLVLGLMAKPMLVTWPFVFLLLDYWPLRRRMGIARITEKWPHFLLAIGSCVITILVQDAGGAVRSFEAAPLVLRAQNVIVAYATYLGKTFLPMNLAVLYPLPSSYPIPVVVSCGALLLAITVGALLQHRARPYVLMGWFWFLGTLVPVIGIVQVGEQAYADRYTYLPSLGVFLIVAWLLRDGARRNWGRTLAVLAACSVSLGCLAAVARVQVSHWRDSESLYTHSLAVTGTNPTIHYNFGTALLAAGRDAEAQKQLAAAAGAMPSNPSGLTNLAIALSEQKKYEEAADLLHRVIEEHPAHVEAYINLGVIALRQGVWNEGIAYLKQALDLDPENEGALLNLGIGYAEAGRWAEAEPVLHDVVARTPDDYTAQYEWGRALARTGRAAEAVAPLERALHLNPKSADVWYQLGNVYLGLQRGEEARMAFEQVLALEPNHGAAELNLGIVLASEQNLDAAILHLRRAVALRPESADAHFNLALALKLLGQNAEATAHASEALRLNPNDTNARQLVGELSR